MKIGLEVNRVLNAYNNTSKTGKTKSNKPVSKDQVDISSVGRELAKYVDIAKNSELADKKVDEIKRQVSNNQYFVDSKTLAKNILEYIKESDR